MTFFDLFTAAGDTHPFGLCPLDLSNSPSSCDSSDCISIDYSELDALLNLLYPPKPTPAPAVTSPAPTDSPITPGT